MDSRKEILKSFLSKQANKKVVLHDFSYSAIVRFLRQHLPEKVESFLKIFKEKFEEAVNNNLENPDKLALVSAVKHIGIKINVRS